VCLTDVYADEGNWRKCYWDKFYESITTKLDAWSDESEYRMIISELIVNHDSKESRTLTYNFDDLEGLVFGINTTEDIKLRLIKIIEDKCRACGRKDFKFYQCYYATHAGQVQTVELIFLKFAS
jgi:hypothetical protein